MPTYNRRRFVPQALHGWLAQDYGGPMELIVLDDGEDAVGDLVADALRGWVNAVYGAEWLETSAVDRLDDLAGLLDLERSERQIHYLHLDKRMTIGAKKNIGMTIARGEICATWDDDDWHAPGHLRAQATALASTPGAQIAGSNHCLFWDVNRQIAARYRYATGKAPAYLVGGTQMWRRSFWEERAFPDLMLGEDNGFMKGRLKGRAAMVAEETMVAVIHGGNTSPSRITWHEQYTPVDLAELRALMGQDFDVYAAMAASS